MGLIKKTLEGICAGLLAISLAGCFQGTPARITKITPLNVDRRMENRFGSYGRQKLMTDGVTPEVALAYPVKYKLGHVEMMQEANIMPSEVQDFDSIFNPYEVRRLVRMHVTPAVANKRMKNYGFSIGDWETIPRRPKLLARNIPYDFYMKRRDKDIEQIIHEYMELNVSKTMRKELKEMYNIDLIGRYSVDVLHELARNRSKSYKADKKVVLFIMEKTKYHLTFDDHFGLISTFMKDNKVFVYETDKGQEAIDSIAKFGSYHGMKNGEPVKPIEVLYLLGHGTPISVAMGANNQADGIAAAGVYDFDELHIDMGDKTRLAKVSKYVGTEDKPATGVLISCDTGKGDVNIARMLFGVFPNMDRMYAPKVSSNTWKVDLSNGIKPIYECKKDEVLVLRR